MAIIQRSLQLTEHASARTATLRFCRIVSKVNKAYSSSGKEDFPEAGEDLFGKGFASRLKERTETAAELSEAKKWDTRIFSQTLYVFVSSWHVEGHGTRDDEEPCRVAGKPELVLINQGESATFSPQAKPQASNNHRYVPKSFTKTLCLSTSSRSPQVFSGQSASYFTDYPWVLETIMGYKIERIQFLIGKPVPALSFQLPKRRPFQRK